MLRLGSLIVAGLCLAGCLSPMRFGARSFERTTDTDGVPTYLASGRVGNHQPAEPEVAKVMQTACPSGNPRLLFGNVMAIEGQAARTWTATFTCDEAIPGLTSSD